MRESKVFHNFKLLGFEHRVVPFLLGLVDRFLLCADFFGVHPPRKLSKIKLTK